MSVVVLLVVFLAVIFFVVVVVVKHHHVVVVGETIVEHFRVVVDQIGVFGVAAFFNKMILLKLCLFLLYIVLKRIFQNTFEQKFKFIYSKRVYIEFNHKLLTVIFSKILST